MPRRKDEEEPIMGVPEYTAMPTPQAFTETTAMPEMLGMSRAALSPEEMASQQNLTPYVSPGPSANPLIQDFKNREMARLLGMKDITGAMPMGERMRLTAGGGESAVPPLYPASPAKGQEKAATVQPDPAATMRSAVNPETGALPWDFWARNPGLSGGVATIMEGPNKGKTFTLVEPSAAENFQTKVDTLMSQWIDRVSSAISQGEPSTAIEKLLRQMPSIMSAQTSAATAPSVIQKNIADASRATFLPNIASGGPGELETMMVPPGGKPVSVAKGKGEGRGAFAPDTMMANLVPRIAEKFLESAFDVTQGPEAQAQAMEGFVKMMQFAENYQSKRNQPTVQPVVDWPTYYRKAKAMNPKATDEEVRSAYLRRFGGQR